MVAMSASSTDGVASVQLAEGTLQIAAGEEVQLIATMDGGGILDVAAGDYLLVGGDIGSDEQLSAVRLQSGLISLGGEGTVVRRMAASGDIEINAHSEATFLEGLPSIIGFGEGLTVASSGGDIRIGNNQGMSHVSNVVLDAAGELTVGDLTAAGDLTLKAEAINVWRRLPRQIATPGGLVNSTVTSIVSGGTLDVQGTLTDTGLAGEPALFAAVDGIRGVPVGRQTRVDSFDAGELVLVGDSGKEQLYLKALDGPLPSSVGGDEVAAESEQGEVSVEADGDEANRTTADLSDLGISLVDGADRPVPQGRLARTGFTIDGVTNRQGDTLVSAGGLVPVMRSRVNTKFARQAVADYALAMQIASPDGGVTQAGQLLADAQTAYQEESVTSEEPVDYRAWLASGDSTLQTQASDLIARLDAAFESLRLAGLTADEVNASRRYVERQLSAGGESIQLVLVRTGAALAG